MANEIGPVYGEASDTLYATVNGTGVNAGLVYRVSAQTWEALDTLARSNYAVALTEAPAASGKYYANLPAGLGTSEAYPLSIYEQAGGSPATIDILAAASAVGPADANIVAVLGDPSNVIDIADIATAVWASGTRTLTSFGTLVADIWSYVSRTLTTTAVQIVAALAAGVITIRRGDTIEINFTGLGDITGRTKLWVTIKVSEEEADSAAVLQWEETGGLLVLNGEVATPSDGSLVVTNQTTGAVTVNLVATASAQLTPESSLYYDVQVALAGEVHTLTQGRAIVDADVTHAVA